MNEIHLENIDPDDDIIEDDIVDPTLDLPEPLIPLQIAIQQLRYVQYQSNHYDLIREALMAHFYFKYHKGCTMTKEVQRKSERYLPFNKNGYNG